MKDNMTTHTIAVSDECTISVIVTEGNTAGNTKYLKFERTTVVDGTRSFGEVFLTPTQLVSLGKYLIEQANNT